MSVLRVAIAEGEPDTLRFLQWGLVRSGHKLVIVATDGQQLLDGVRREPPDIVVTDLYLPGRHGLEVLRSIWEEQAVPAVIGTGTESVPWLDERPLPYVMAWLIKPVRIVDLTCAIALAHLRFQHLRRLEPLNAILWAMLCHAASTSMAAQLVSNYLRIDTTASETLIRDCATQCGCSVSEVVHAVLLCHACSEMGQPVIPSPLPALSQATPETSPPSRLLNVVMKKLLNKDCDSSVIWYRGKVR